MSEEKKKLRRSALPARKRASSKSKSKPIELQEEQQQQQQQLEFNEPQQQQQQQQDNDDRSAFLKEIQQVGGDLAKLPSKKKARLKTNVEMLLRDEPDLLEEQEKFFNEPLSSRRARYPENWQSAKELPTWEETGHLLSTEKAHSKKRAKKKSKNSNPETGPEQARAYNEEMNGRIAIYNGGLQELEADMVVVSSQRSNVFAGPVSVLINDVGGEHFKREVNAVIKKMPPYTSDWLTQSVNGFTTAGYGGSYDYVHQSFVRISIDLETLYKPALDEAEKYQCATVVLTCMGTSGFQIDAETAAKSAIRSVRDHFETTDYSHIKRVVFCCQKLTDYQAYIQHLGAYFPLDGDGTKSTSTKQNKKAESVRLEDLVRPELGLFSYKNISSIQANSGFQQLTHLDLSSCPDIATDITFFYLNQAFANKKHKTMESLNLTCAYELTDAGLLFALDTFPKLKTLNITSCSKITDRGMNLAVHLNLGTELENLHCKFTSVLGFHLPKGEFVETTSTKIVIVHQDFANSFLAGQNSKDKTSIFQYAEGQTALFNYATVQTSNNRVNIFECHVSIAHLFVNWGTLVVAPSFESVPAILSMPKFCGLLVVMTESDEAKAKSFVKETYENIQHRLLNEARSLKHSWSGVTSLSCMAAQMKRLDIILSNEFVVYHRKLKLEKNTSFDSWYGGLQKLIKNTPAFKQLETIKVPLLKEDKVLGQTMLQTLFSESPIKKVPFKWHQMASILNELGDIFYDAETQLAIYDLTLFSRVLNFVSTGTGVETFGSHDDKTGTRCVVPYLKHGGVFRYYQVYEQMQTKSKGKIAAEDMNLLIRLLQTSGFFIHIPQAWLNDITPTPAGVVAQKCVATAESEKHSSGKDDIEKIMTYTLVVNGSSIGFDCIRMLSRLFRTNNLGQTFYFGQHTCVDIILQCVSDTLQLTCRTNGFHSMVENDNDKKEQSGIKTAKTRVSQMKTVLNNTFRLVCLIIEATLTNSGYGYFHSIQCDYCSLKQKGEHRIPVIELLNADVQCDKTKNVCTASNHSVDSCFTPGCDHSQVLMNCTVERTLSCSLCAKLVRFEENKQTCKQCILCIDCIRLLQLAANTVGKYDAVTTSESGVQVISQWAEPDESLMEGLTAKQMGATYNHSAKNCTYVCRKCRQRFSGLKKCARHENGCTGSEALHVRFPDDQASEAPALTQTHNDVVKMENGPILLKYHLNSMAGHTIHIQPIANPKNIFIRLDNRNQWDLQSLMDETGLREVIVSIKWEFDSACVSIKDSKTVPNVLTLKNVEYFYIILQEMGAEAVVHSEESAFLAPLKTTVEENAVLEITIENNSEEGEKVSPGTVLGVDEKGLLKIALYDETELTYPVTSNLLHPIGYAAHMEINFTEGPEFDWKQIITKAQSYDPVSPLPYVFFNQKQTADSPELRIGLNNSVKLATAKDGWQIGMRLEALDRLNPSLVCVATVKDVKKAHGKVTITFDGWTNKYDYETETASADLHPIGWCEHVNHKLEAPKSYQKTFKWYTYLQEQDSPPVPYELFGRNQTNNCPKHPIYDGAYTVDDDEISKKEEDVAVCLKTHNWLHNWLGSHAATASPLTLVDRNWSKANFGTVRANGQQWNSSFVLSAAHRGRLVPHVQSTVESLTEYYHGNNYGFAPAELPKASAGTHATYSPVHNFTGSAGCLVETYHVSGWHHPVSSEQLKPICLTKEGTKEPHCTFKIINTLAPLIIDGHRLLLRSRIDDNPNIDRMLSSKNENDQEESAKELRLEILYRIVEMVGSTIAALTVTEAFCKSCKVPTCRGGCKTQGMATDEPNLPESKAAGVFTKKLGEDTFHVNEENQEKLSELFSGDICGFCDVDIQPFPTRSRIGPALRSQELLHAHVLAWPKSSDTVDLNFSTSLNVAVSTVRHLTFLALPDCGLTEFPLPNGTGHWSETLLHLDLSKNKLQKIPSDIFKLKSLRCLMLMNCCLRGKLPVELTQLQNLEILLLSGNCMVEGMKSEDNPLLRLQQLRVVNFSAPERLDLRSESFSLTGETIFDYFNKINLLDNETDERLFEKGYNRLSEQVIEKEEELEQLTGLLSELVPRFDADDEFKLFTRLRCLRVLYLRNHKFADASVFDPDRTFYQLEQLYLDNNLELRNIDTFFGNFQHISTIGLKNCAELVTPPLEVAKKGTPAVIAYFRRLLAGRKFCRRTKLMFCGLGGAGKTSMVKKLRDDVLRSPDEADVVITDGIDIAEWTVRVKLSEDDAKTTKINYSMWDFAGQSVYYNTHQFFLSDRAIYFLLWNARLGYEHAGLDFWLSSIASHAPKAPIFVIATHCDQVFRTDLPKKQLKAAFPQICDFFSISCVTGAGFDHLQQILLKVTHEQPYMNEQVPTAWLKLEKDIVKMRSEKSVTSAEDIQQLAAKHDLLDVLDVRQALEFLHDLGSVQYFKNEFLRDKIVISPQWLVDVMACLISVKESVIVNGRFKRQDVSKIWEKYDQGLHDWLLKLTEEFDLTFYLAEEKVNVVPCLLPEQEPEYNWPELAGDLSEMKLVYTFDYLPTGLFNRTQSRLCQYSDSTIIWKRGSFMRKNQHIALLKETRDKQIVLKVQGLRPENVLFLVHEIIETLIADFYRGVKYDLSIPCVDCLKVGTQNPHMFSQNHIRRALTAQAPVLQCDKNFHICALAALRELLPPSNTNEYTSHLSGMMSDLDSMKHDVTVDALIICAQKDAKDKTSKHVTPDRLKTDLKEQGEINSTIIPIGGTAKENNESMKALSYKMTSCHVVLVLVTDALCNDENSSNVISYIKQQTHRNFIAVIGKNSKSDWRTSGVGLFVTEEIYVDVQKMSKYEQKLPEIIHRCKSALKTSRSMNATARHRVKPTDVFVSYCWRNSKMAADKGQTAFTKDSIAGGDPRAIDQLLTSNDIDVWLDVRSMRDGALFEEIANGLKATKLVLVFISDEYLKSDNCKREFNFVGAILKKPMILCPVGRGNAWQKSTLTLLAANTIRIDPTKQDELLQEVKKQLLELSANDTCQISDKKTNKRNDVNEYDAYKEVCELAQRKLSQTVAKAASYARKKDAALEKAYPRLLYIDLNDNINVVDLLKEMAKSAFAKGAKGARPKSGDRGARLSADAQSRQHRRSSSATRANGGADGNADVTTARAGKDGTGEHKKSIRKSATVTQALQQLDTSDFVVRYLCEIDGQWHLTGQALELKSGLDVDRMFAQIAAYQAAVLSVLQHSAVQVNLFRITKWPDAVLTHFKELAAKETDQNLQFERSYLNVWQLARDADMKVERAGLTRCALHSRRVVWLCDRHKGIARGELADDVLEEDDSAPVPSTEIAGGNQQQGGDDKRPTSAAIPPKSTATRKPTTSETTGTSRATSKEGRPSTASTTVSSAAAKERQGPLLAKRRESPFRYAEGSAERMVRKKRSQPAT